MLESTEFHRQRIVRIRRDLLLAALGLPEGTRLVDISRDMFFFNDELALKIEHPDFKPVPAYQAIPEVTPMLGEKRIPVFMGWGEK